MAQLAVVEDLIHDFPVPQFGSPPSAWTTIGNMLGQSGSFFAGIGVADWTSNPLLIVAGGGVYFLIWLVKPAIRVFRRWIGERAARAMGVEYRIEDER